MYKYDKTSAKGNNQTDIERKENKNGYVRKTNQDMCDIYNVLKINTVIKSRKLVWLFHTEKMVDTEKHRWESARVKRNIKEKVAEYCHIGLKEKDVKIQKTETKTRKLWEKLQTLGGRCLLNVI